MREEKLVICKIPKAGLGNQLFPLMRAYTFAHLNHLPVWVYNYHQVKLGPWLRGEKSKRKYRGFFSFEKSILAHAFLKRKILQMRNKELINEPHLEKLDSEAHQQTYFFNAIPPYQHYFDGLQENRELVRQLFWDLVSAKIKKSFEKSEPPIVGIHIRMGDFKKPEDGVKFGTVGHTRSPENYFVEMIHSLRKMHGSTLPVSVFTDGRKNELKELFQLEEVFLVEGNNDLTDLLLLSRGKIIVTSAGSTFSYWAAFLSDAIVIVHPTYTSLKIRPEKISTTLYEGAFDENNVQLVNAIKQISV